MTVLLPPASIAGGDADQDPIWGAVPAKEKAIRLARWQGG